MTNLTRDFAPWWSLCTGTLVEVTTPRSERLLNATTSAVGDATERLGEHVREKIVEGMLNKRFYAESVLEEQTWIHDTSLTVGKALERGGLELIEYAWLSVG